MSTMQLPYLHRHPYAASDKARRSLIESTIAAALFIGAAGLYLAPAPANAADIGAARQVYEQERARCMHAPVTEDRQACLTSAGAAFEEAKQGRLDVAPHPYDQNRMARCQALPESDRQDCVMRMQGAGIQDGSVSEGGIYRELTTVQPAQPYNNDNR